MSSFNYWISQGYTPEVAQKLAKSKNQAGLIAKDQEYRAQQAIINPPEAPKPPMRMELQQPLDLSSENRSRLTTNTRSRRKRASSRRAQRRLTTGLNTGGGGGSQGGISF